MAKVTVFIERGDDGTYGAFIEQDMPYGIIGEGNTVAETIEDFNIGYEEMRAHYLAENMDFPEFEFEFMYDVPSFLQYYAKSFSLAGLSNITGINQGQLSHYLTGHRRPSQRTVEKIQGSLHAFAQEISVVRFI